MTNPLAAYNPAGGFFMRKSVYGTVIALLLTAGLIYFAVNGGRGDPSSDTVRFQLIRVWSREEEPAVGTWLKKMAAAYEKQTGVRVYLRKASPEETQRDSGASRPDLLVLPDGEQIIALRGYALILKDETVRVKTPQPTGVLFFRPSPTPGPSPTPAPWPQGDELGAVLASEALLGRLPGTVLSTDPAAQLSQGKANAALLTAGQAAQLGFGFRAYALPEGKGFLRVGASAYSDGGEAFLRFLLSSACQLALRDAGLFSPVTGLYSPEDPIRYLIDNSRAD